MDIEKLAIIMKKGFDSVYDRFDAMDARFDTLEQEVRAIRSELADIKQRLDDLEHVTGYAKEIDSMMERIAIIEKRLDKQAV